MNDSSSTSSEEMEILIDVKEAKIIPDSDELDQDIAFKTREVEVDILTDRPLMQQTKEKSVAQ